MDDHVAGRRGGEGTLYSMWVVSALFASRGLERRRRRGRGSGLVLSLLWARCVFEDGCMVLLFLVKKLVLPWRAKTTRANLYNIAAIICTYSFTLACD